MSKLIELVSEQTSPLFRIMSVFNYDLPQKTFQNNIICSHIGNGYFLSVAHNLRVDHGIPASIPNDVFQEKFLQCFDGDERTDIENKFNYDAGRDKWIYKNTNSKKDAISLKNKLNTCSYTTTFLESYNNEIAKPYVVIQFRNDQFYNSVPLTEQLRSKNYMYEKKLNRHTYILELEIYHTSWEDDICVYKLVDRDPAIINALPSLSVDTTLYDGTENSKIYCLQSSPTSSMGKLLNEARIEGVSDHYSMQNKFKPTYIHEGMRYLMMGYFRFGSSGAPYITYNQETKAASIFGIQSEACPVQLSIRSKRDGNFQYTKAIVSPLNNITDILNQLNEVESV
jgi:hypothetical protein